MLENQVICALHSALIIERPLESETKSLKCANPCTYWGSSTLTTEQRRNLSINNCHLWKTKRLPSRSPDTLGLVAEAVDPSYSPWRSFGSRSTPPEGEPPSGRCRRRGSPPWGREPAPVQNVPTVAVGRKAGVVDFTFKKKSFRKLL